MNPGDTDHLTRASMLELFRAEVETQAAALTSGLLELERTRESGPIFETLMRAAHSVKGAARIVNQPLAVRLAHALEDCFVAAQRDWVTLGQAEMDLLLRGVDLLVTLAKQAGESVAGRETEWVGEVESLLQSLAQLINSHPPAGPGPDEAAALQRGPPRTGASTEGPSPDPQADGPMPEWLSRPGGRTPRKTEPSERTLRLGAENLNRLLALAGESLVESRWLRPFGDSLQRLKRQQMEVTQRLEELRAMLPAGSVSAHNRSTLDELVRQAARSQQFLNERVQELDMFDRRSSHLAQRLYLEVLRTRMRPFSDGVRRFPRMVRDLALGLGKNVKLEITGDSTQVDRDILERLEAPLAHLLRNAVDHGCEPPEVRHRLGKPAEGTLRLEARHSAGVLLISVSDDGAGVDLEAIRAAAIQKRLVAPAVALKLSDADLLGFLFFPGFTLKPTVTEISGRGFGLDVVQNMVKGVRGAIRLHNERGRGLRVQLQLPLTLSVVRALLVEVGGEPYAIPLNQITRTLKLPQTAVQVLEGLPHFEFDRQQIGLLTAHQVLECGQPSVSEAELSVVVLSARSTRYGLVVDRLLGERELVVQPLDSRLGSVRDISAAALMEDGAPVLILDVEGVVHSIEKLLAEGRLGRVTIPAPHTRAPKRVLAVDDSLTVRELERKLLSDRGYLADVAKDGLEAWQAVQSGAYALVITDVEMPRLDGIQLATRIKQDPRLHALPVLILSYKERESDRLRGLEAGAEYYLTKGGFEDDSLLQAVIDLIGEPDS